MLIHLCTLLLYTEQDVTQHIVYNTKVGAVFTISLVEQVASRRLIGTVQFARLLSSRTHRSQGGVDGLDRMARSKTEWLNL